MTVSLLKMVSLIGVLVSLTVIEWLFFGATSTLRCLIDVPSLRQLIFQKFSTRDILIPTPLPPIDFEAISRPRQSFYEATSVCK